MCQHLQTRRWESEIIALGYPNSAFATSFIKSLSKVARRLWDFSCVFWIWDNELVSESLPPSVSFPVATMTPYLQWKITAHESPKDIPAPQAKNICHKKIENCDYEEENEVCIVYWRFGSINMYKYSFDNYANITFPELIIRSISLAKPWNNVWFQNYIFLCDIFASLVYFES